MWTAAEAQQDFPCIVEVFSLCQFCVEKGIHNVDDDAKPTCLVQLSGNMKYRNLAFASFPRSPNGEGGSYDVNGKELRPSLGWTSEMGWTAPISKGTHALRAQLEAAKYDVIKYCTGTPYTRLCLYGRLTEYDDRCVNIFSSEGRVFQV
ncbi:hypothetical protein C5167_011483 [Papaver somniferum]|uniref:Uncharacterized protein n=1 Tax=Papaver somniferum TaxID=3469 RepID=A0A4Y7K626_PAPSO|nr:hypothetical protein C5167_011483 [Papaver somniferum]